MGAARAGEGSYEFGWLDRVLDGLHEAGILVDLATPTAAPPPWFSRANPSSLPVTRDGQVLGIGARESFCPSSPDYRRAAERIAGALGERYGEHPALALWHVHNEYGSHVGPCYCETSAEAFRGWLRARYGTLGALNDAWGTTFWGQRYHAWGEITAPVRAPMPVNPAQQLDFMRFSSAEYLECFRRERDVLRARTPDVPITTNFMATACRHMDYWSWAPEVDVVTTSHYLIAEDPDNHVHLAMTADLARGLAGRPPVAAARALDGRGQLAAPQPRQGSGRDAPQLAGAHRRAAPTARCSSSGAPRASGRRSSTPRCCPMPGRTAGSGARSSRSAPTSTALAEVKGSEVRADAAIVWDWEAWWALELEFRPTSDVEYLERIRAFYGALWEAKATADFVAPTAALDRYRLVVVPSLYVVSEAVARNLTAYVEQGGRLVVSFFSGIVDEHDRVPPGPHPGALRDLLGLTIEEFHPLAAGEAAALEGGLSGDVWSERVVPAGAETVLRFLDGPDAGEPAVTRHAVGRGTATYLATRLRQDALRALLEPELDAAGAARERGLPAAVEAVRRERDGRSYLFLLNHGDAEARVAAAGHDLLDGSEHRGEVVLAPGGVRVLRQ